MATTEIRLTDAALCARIERVGNRRGDVVNTKTVRDLLHERLLELEEHGDPAALTPAATATDPTPPKP